MNPHKYRADDTRDVSMEIFDRLEWEGGAKVYFKNRPYPMKGYLTQDRVYALDLVKQLMRHPRLFKKLAWVTMKPYILQDQYLSPFALELRKLLNNFFSDNTSNIISHVLEYDNAYRLRVQDLFSETTKESFAAQPIKTLWKLLKINKKRDYQEVHSKFRIVVIFVSLCLLLPHIRLKFKRAMRQAHYQNLCLDKGDRYWINQRTDYKANI